MKIDIPDQLARDVKKLLKILQEDCSETDANTHGRLTLRTLVLMLLEDVCMLQSRPGCWEATNMQAVMESHGYGN